MKQLITLISALLFLVICVSHAWALPACPSSGYFHNCYGTYTYASGNKYVGEWKDNKKNGQGTFTFANGTIEEGIFKDDVFQPKTLIKTSENSDKDYVTITLPQGIQFPVPKNWQNMMGSKGIIEDFVNNKLYQHSDKKADLFFAAKGFDANGDVIGQITLSFNSFPSSEQKLSQLEDNDFAFIDNQVRSLRKGKIKQAGGHLLADTGFRAKIKDKFYHVIFSTRANQTERDAGLKFVNDINLRYYDSENPFSIFISHPTKALHEIIPILEKFYSEFENNTDEEAATSKATSEMSGHQLKVLSKTIPYKLLETNKKASILLNNIDGQLELMSKFCEKKKTELKWQDFYYPPLLTTSFADYFTNLEDGGGFSPIDFEASGIVFLPEDPCLTTRFAKLSPKVNERVKSFLKIHDYNKQGEIYSRDNECRAKNGTEAHHLILFSDGKVNQNFYLEEDILSIWGGQADSDNSNLLSIGSDQKNQTETLYESILNLSLADERLGTLIEFEFPNLAFNSDNTINFEERFAVGYDNLKYQVEYRYGITWFEKPSWDFPQYDNLSIAKYFNGNSFNEVVRLVYSNELDALNASKILNTRLTFKRPQRSKGRDSYTFNKFFSDRGVSITSYLNYAKLNSDSKFIVEYHFKQKNKFKASSNTCLSKYEYSPHLISGVINYTTLFNNLLPAIERIYKP